MSGNGPESLVMKPGWRFQAKPFRPSDLLGQVEAILPGWLCCGRRAVMATMVVGPKSKRADLPGDRLATITADRLTRLFVGRGALAAECE
jgi:hypothetical protein